MSNSLHQSLMFTTKKSHYIAAIPKQFHLFRNIYNTHSTFSAVVFKEHKDDEDIVSDLYTNRELMFMKTSPSRQDCTRQP
ncbi:hypothetical protein ABKN59_007262 [Abortiporus biennis]